jgi:hypothetical protein
MGSSQFSVFEIISPSTMCNWRFARSPMAGSWVTMISRGMRVFSLRAPFYVPGSFNQPHVSVDKGVMALKAESAFALVILVPITVLMPLIKTGPGKKSECANLLAIARIKPVSPPPGKTYPMRSPRN